MKVEAFETAIDKIGLEKKEVRLEKNNVRWFLCGGNDDYDIIVYDAQGKALVLYSFEWPEEVNDIKIDIYRDKNKQILGVTINGEPALRDSRYDLDLGPLKVKRYMCITCTMFEYCVEENGITGECLSCEDYERVEDKIEGIMKRTYEGWLARDERGELFLGQNMPNNDCGYWVNMGECMQLKDSDFPEVTFEKSPVKVRITIEDAVENYRQKITVKKSFSPVIGALPCVVGCCKVSGSYVYLVEVEGAITIARHGEVIAQKENGEWCVQSRFKDL